MVVRCRLGRSRRGRRHGHRPPGHRGRRRLGARRWDGTPPTPSISSPPRSVSRVRHHWSSGNGGEVGVVTANWAARAIAAWRARQRGGHRRHRLPYAGQVPSAPASPGTAGGRARAHTRCSWRASRRFTEHRDRARHADADPHLSHLRECASGQTRAHPRRAPCRGGGAHELVHRAVAATNPHAWFPQFAARPTS